MCCSQFLPAFHFGRQDSSSQLSLPSFSPSHTYQDTQVPGWLRELMKGHDSNAHLMTGLKGMTQGNFMMWMGTCNACGKMRQAGHGLFCSNFWLGREGFRPCRNVWCGKCYRESESDPFPRLDDNEEANVSDLDLDTTESNQQHRCGRNRDHLMGVPFEFECDLCSFRNVTGWDPVLGDHNDHFTLVTIRRVLLDVMWAREP